MKCLRVLITSFLLTAACAAQSITITEGPKVETTTGSAIIRWKTNSVCGTHVRFGLSEGKLDQKASGDTGVDHKIELDGLKTGGTYFYSVGTAKYELTKGSFSMNGRAPVTDGGKKTAPAVTTVKPAEKTTLKPPPLQMMWGHLPSLQDHFERHGKDVGATSTEDYARKAWEFYQRGIDEQLPTKLDESDGTIRVWDPKTHTFAAYNRNGSAKTIFKPESAGYFERQPGKPVHLKRN